MGPSGAAGDRVRKIRPQTIRTLVAAGLVVERRVSYDSRERTRAEITKAGRAAVEARPGSEP